MMRQTILAAAMLASLGGCSSRYAGLPDLSATPDKTYRLGAGDELRVAVFGFDTMTNTYTVSDVGTISMPLIDTVAVAGKSPAEVEAAIAGTLRSRDLAPRASVSIQVTKFRPFYILGEVQKPGQYSYVPGMSVLSAVSMAGGYTFRANTKYAAVTRNERQVVVKGRLRPDEAIMPGDTIMVSETWF